MSPFYTTLRDVLPGEALIEWDEASPFWRHLDRRVVRRVDGRDIPWPGRHKNVSVWWLLDNGIAVGWNENTTSVGWSFPVCRVPAGLDIETWKDVMPAMPTDRAVPFIEYTTVDGYEASSTRGVDSSSKVGLDHQHEVVVKRDPDPEACIWGTLRTRRTVDLEDDQGFAYAVRWLYRENSLVAGRFLNAWVRDCVTAKDRMDLARAILGALEWRKQREEIRNCRAEKRQ